MSTQLGEVSRAISNMAEEIAEDIKSEDKYEAEKQKILILMEQANIQLEDIRVKKEKNGRYIVDIYPAINDISKTKKEKIHKIIKITESTFFIIIHQPSKWETQFQTEYQNKGKCQSIQHICRLV